MLLTRCSLHRLQAGAVFVSVAWLAAVWFHLPCGVSAEPMFDVDARIEELRAVSTGGDSSAPYARREYLAGLYALGRTEEALRGWREWVAEDPRTLARVDRLYWFCLALMETEHTGEAAALLEDARTTGLLDSERAYWHGMAKELLCAAYLELAECEQARELASEVVRHGAVPEARALATYDLARAYEALGDSIAAREAWELIATTAEGTPEAAYAGQRLRGPAVDSPRQASSLASPAAGAPLYCLQLGSCRDRAIARAWAAVAKDAGLEVFIREDPCPLGTLFTVLAVGFRTREEAILARQRLASVGHRGVVVTGCVFP